MSSDSSIPFIPKNISSSSSSSSSSNLMADKTFKSIGNLIKLLPTGTVFVFQFLNPVLTNIGKCSIANKIVSSVLIGLCGVSCAFSCFTDSFKGPDGSRKYGIATAKGLWTYADAGSFDLSKYKLNFGDFVHAFFAVIVFAVVSLLDGNTVSCFYPSFERAQKALVMALPPVIGVVSASVFALFPTKRHGVGYPPNGETDESKNPA